MNEDIVKEENKKELNNINQDDLRYHGVGSVFKSGLLGFIIGLAVIIPGVSGSTISIIFKLYEKILFAISNFFKKLVICLLFLLPIGIGAIVGVGLGFITIQLLLDILPFAVACLFGGLMLGALPSVSEQVKGEKITILRIVLFSLGILIPIVVTILSTFLGSGIRSLENLQFYHYLIFIAIGFVVAITQLVPGLSGTAFLMMLGYFKPLMDSVHFSYWSSNPMIFVVYGCLILGFVIGLFVTSKILLILIKKWHASSFSMIIGLSIGSVATMFFNPDIYQTYKQWSTSINWLDLGLGIGLFIIGCACAFFFVMYERHTNKIQ